MKIANTYWRREGLPQRAQDREVVSATSEPPDIVFTVLLICCCCFNLYLCVKQSISVVKIQKILLSLDDDDDWKWLIESEYDWRRSTGDRLMWWRQNGQKSLFKLFWERETERESLGCREREVGHGGKGGGYFFFFLEIMI